MKKTSSDEPTGSENNETVFFCAKIVLVGEGQAACALEFSPGPPRPPWLGQFWPRSCRGLSGPGPRGSFDPGAAAGAFLAPVPGAVLAPELWPGPFWPRRPGPFWPPSFAAFAPELPPGSLRAL